MLATKLSEIYKLETMFSNVRYEKNRTHEKIYIYEYPFSTFLGEGFENKVLHFINISGFISYEFHVNVQSRTPQVHKVSIPNVFTIGTFVSICKDMGIDNLVGAESSMTLSSLFNMDNRYTVSNDKVYVNDTLVFFLNHKYKTCDISMTESTYYDTIRRENLELFSLLYRTFVEHNNRLGDEFNHIRASFKIPKSIDNIILRIQNAVSTDSSTALSNFNL